MGPDPVLGPVVDRAQVQVDGLDGAEVAFDAGQTLVGGHHLARAHLLGADGGADDVQPVQGRLGGDGLGVALVAEGVVGDGQGVVLGHLVPADDFADPDPDLAGPVQAPGTGGGGGDLCQLGVGGVQQGQAFAGPLRGQGGVAAGDQAFPGVVGWVISARLVWSNRDICKGPSSAARAAIAGARSAVTQPNPPSSRSSSTRALVIIPRSPTITMSLSLNVSLTAWTMVVNAVGSAVLPGNTRTATGRPAGSVSSPYSIWGSPFLPSREYPRAASGQCRPVTQEEERSNRASRSGLPTPVRWVRTSLVSMASWRPCSQSIAAYTSSVVASATARSSARDVSAHQRVVASFEPGRHTRAMIRASAMSRSRPAGPSNPGSPRALAWAWTAATCPWGTEPVASKPSPATTSVLPVSEARTASIAACGNGVRFARVSCLTLWPPREGGRAGGR